MQLVGLCGHKTVPFPDKFLNKRGELGVKGIADDDVGAVEILGLFGPRLGHTACDGNDGRGELTPHFVKSLAGLSVAFGGDGAGVDHYYVGNVSLFRAFNAVFFEKLPQRLGVIPIHLAPEGFKKNRHFLLSSFAESSFGSFSSGRKRINLEPMT